MFRLLVFSRSMNTCSLGPQNDAAEEPRGRVTRLIVKGLALSAALLTTSFSYGQATCPVVLLAANPGAASVISGTALSLTFHNASSAAITGIVFNAEFGLSRRINSLTERYPLDPGKTGVDQWGDNRLLALLHISNTVTVWPQMVLFADGTNWADDGSHQCGIRSGGTATIHSDDSSVDATSSAPRPQTTALDALTSQPAVGVATGNEATHLSADQKIALIEEGKASLCTVHTYPAQATITVDGKYVGMSPLSFVLLKSSTPRDMYIMLPGYKLYYRAIDPNGSPIPVSATLAPLNSAK
jgi:hypothetical protein